MGQLAVSEYSLNSSSASIFSESQYSTASHTDVSTPIPRAKSPQRQPPPQAAINRLGVQPLPAALDEPRYPFWIELPGGFNTEGKRVCWAPTKLKQRNGQRTSTVPGHRLQLLENHELKSETNQHWLLEGIRFKKLVLYRKEFQGPAAQLVVFREHKLKPRAPFHMNVPRPLRIGKVIPHWMA